MQKKRTPEAQQYASCFTPRVFYFHEAAFLFRKGIEAVFPHFADFNTRIRRPGGFRLSLPATQRIWPTASGKAEFIAFQGVNEGPQIGGGDVLKLTTLRSHDQYNTTIYGLDDRYRGVFGRRDVIVTSEEDLTAQNLEHGDLVDVETALPSDRPRRLLGYTVIAYKIASGSWGPTIRKRTCSCRSTTSIRPAARRLTSRFRFVFRAGWFDWGCARADRTAASE